jgi:hypothetical protein
MYNILRKCWRDGSSSNDYKYGNVGGIEEAADFRSNRRCGRGLHGLLNAKGDWRYLKGVDWLVIRPIDKVIEIDKDKCKFNRGELLYRGKKDGLFPYFEISEFDSRTAYYWGKYVGNRDVMINYVTNSEWAYKWAYHIGNRNVMIDRVTESKWAYYWMETIGNKNIMSGRI